MQRESVTHIPPTPTPKRAGDGHGYSRLPYGICITDAFHIAFACVYALPFQKPTAGTLLIAAEPVFGLFVIYPSMFMRFVLVRFASASATNRRTTLRWV